MRPGLFRAKALDRLSSPEQLDQLMRVTSPRSWLALAGFAAVIVAAVVWGFVGNLPRTVNGQAILTDPEGIANVVTTSPGLVVEILVAPGDLVAQGDVIVRLEGLDSGDPGDPGVDEATPVGSADGLVDVTSPRDGRVVEILAAPGSLLAIGDPVVSTEGGDESLIAIVYVPDGSGKLIEPGMEVQLSPSTVDASQYGFMIGRVRSVSEYPVTRQGVLSLLANDQLADRFLGAGPVLQVVVELVEDSTTPSGFEWSSSVGPPFALSHGTLGSGNVVLDEQRPVEFVLPES